MTRDWIASLVSRGLRGEPIEVSEQESPEAAAVMGLVSDVREGRHREAYMGLRELKLLDQDEKKRLIGAANESYLMERQLEWTNHGILRSFRFWSEEDKTEYLRMTCDLVANLKEISPYTSLGFGSVLAFARDGDFIPHDDDMDTLIAFDVGRIGKFSEALALIEEVLKSRGYTVHGKLPSHRNVRWKGGKAMDVFVGFIEDGMVSWFPSNRRNLKVGQVFPTQTVKWFGIDCEMPNKPDEYLAATYGADWRNPLPNWNHPWNKAEFSDFI